MKIVLSVVLVFFTVVFIGCTGNKNDVNEISELKPAVPKITRAMAKEKILELSEGLEVYHDDMKEFTLFRCHYDIDESIVIVPYVVLSDLDYSASLNYHVLYCGREPLHFDTLYVKTPEGVKTFSYKNVSILYGYAVVEEYNGSMDNEVYDTLKRAVNAGYAKIRLEGQQMNERELKQKELNDFSKVFSIYDFFSNVEVEK